MKCPGCGAELKKDREIIKCKKCGTVISLGKTIKKEDVGWTGIKLGDQTIEIGKAYKAYVIIRILNEIGNLLKSPFGLAITGIGLGFLGVIALFWLFVVFTFLGAWGIKSLGIKLLIFLVSTLGFTILILKKK